MIVVVELPIKMCVQGCVLVGVGEYRTFRYKFRSLYELYNPARMVR